MKKIRSKTVIPSKTTIHVCFSIYDKTGHYSKFLGTTMLSLFENINAQALMVTVHILHDNNLTAENHNKFSYLSKQYNQLVKFYNVDELCIDKVSEIREFFPEIDEVRFSIGTFYRFFISHILPNNIEKVIYLDSDIIVNLDINELWQIELGDKPFGAVPNLFQIKDKESSIERSQKVFKICQSGFVKAEDYFNAGVLLMNLRFMRNADRILLNGMKFLREQQLVQYFDQDVLNYCFSTSYLKLPVKFNRYVMLARSENELTVGKMIYHYAGGHLGLNLDMNDSFNRLWMNYFLKTPWFNVDTIDNILKIIEQFDIEHSALMVPISAMSTNKPRVFVIDEENVNNIEIKFYVRYDEEIIIVEPKSDESLQQLIALMESERDKKAFFIGIPNINLELEKIGFVEGKDFFNIFMSYSPSWTSLKNNYKLILSM